ncbi:MAG: aldo/keto reductase [Dehalococcoidia bacterium]|nr:aldo/keto reductase [Dehalococcoidia bacterium]
MESRTFGRLGRVSALTLGGGGIAQIWGATTREECVATVRAAVEAGIDWLDVAPSYGAGEAERVVGEAFGGALPAGVRISTKCQLGNPPAAEVYDRLRTSLLESFERARVDHVDLFLLHNLVTPDGWLPPGVTSATSAEIAGTPRAGTPRTLFVEAVRPAFERLVSEGLTRACGITGIGIPESVIATLGERPAPAAVQCITNLLDSPGGLKRYEGDARPRAIIEAANASGVGVMGIRAVQAGALTDAIDRALSDGSADRADYEHAAPFRALAKELGESTAALAHRYALSMPGVSTVVLGVKNRTELAECVAAEARGHLDTALMARIDAVGGGRG